MGRVEVDALGELEPSEGEVAKNARGSRPRRYRLEVWASVDEKQKIMERAQAAGLSTSAFMRNVALSVPVRSVYDYAAVADLAGLRGDVGKVGGLLKLWLTRQRADGQSVVELNRALSDIAELKAQILKVMGRV